MNKYLKYFKYVLTHKYFVMIECFKHGLYWRGIKHDWHKFLPSEYIPYAEHFYGEFGIKNSTRDKTGYYKPTDTGDVKFDHAWFLHQKRADHHWQYWILPEDEQGHKILKMSSSAITEMICDWYGASRAQGSKSTVQDWYTVNGHKLQLHQESRIEIETILTLNKIKEDRDEC